MRDSALESRAQRKARVRLPRMPDIDDVSALLFDVDGTLIDSIAAHAQTWSQALSEHGFPCEASRVRPFVGMGGDKLLPAVAGIAANSAQGQAITTRKKALFFERLPQLAPTRGGRLLVSYLRKSKKRVIVATSADDQEMNALLDRAGVDGTGADQVLSTDVDGMTISTPLKVALDGRVIRGHQAAQRIDDGGMERGRVPLDGALDRDVGHAMVRSEVDCDPRSPKAGVESVEANRAPDAAVHQPRAEVPAVGHAAVMLARQLGAADLRGQPRGAVDHHDQVVRSGLEGGQLELDREEHAAMLPDLLAVHEDGAARIDAVEAQDGSVEAVFGDREAPPIGPRPLRNPLGGERVAVDVRVRDLAGTPRVVDRGTGDVRRAPAR